MNAAYLLEGIIEVPNMFKNNTALKNITMIEGFIDGKDISNRFMNYSDAKRYVYKLRKYNHSDWRLPTFEELKFIYEHWKEFSNSGSIGFLPENIGIWTSEKSGDWIICFIRTKNLKGEIKIFKYSYSPDVLRHVLCVR